MAYAPTVSALVDSWPQVRNTCLVALLAAVLGWSCGRSPEAEASSSFEFPEFELAQLDGGTLGSADFTDKVVVFEFWATWCLPCHAQADVLKALYPEFRRQGVEFVGINMGESESRVREFLERRPVPYPVLLDTDETVSAGLGIYGLPTVMVLDRDGKVVFLRTGLSTGSILRDLLEGLTEASAESA